MALTQTLSQLETNVREFTDTGGTNALARHPQSAVYDYINRALGSLHRILTEQLPDQRFLSSTIITTADGTTVYSLPADFDHLISVDMSANGIKSWLGSYEMQERPALSNGTTSPAAVPTTYRLRGSSIEYLPSPNGIYLSTLWYVPTPTQLALSASTVDTINRLDDYIIAYASRFIAVKDKNDGLNGMCQNILAELRAEVQMVARARDKNSPSRIADDTAPNRWGRSYRRRR